MTRMRAVVSARPGGPEVLRLVERAMPEPAAGELLIRVVAAGVNRPDLMQRAGATPPADAGDIFGLEAAGEVIAIGAGVGAFQLGDRVMALLGGGGYATYCVARADHCLAIPSGMSFSTAAALPEALFTIWHNLYERGRLAPGESLLIHGGASGLGSLAIGLAIASGARVVATAGGEEKVGALRRLGVARAIDHQREDFVAVIREELGEDTIDVVLDTLGGEQLSRNLEVMAPEGRHVSLSFFQGAQVSLSLPVVMRKGLTLTSSTLRPKSAGEKARLAACVSRHLLPLITSGRAGPLLYASFPLDAAAEAHRVLEENRNIGKVVLLISATEMDE